MLLFLIGLVFAVTGSNKYFNKDNISLSYIFYSNENKSFNISTYMKGYVSNAAMDIIVNASVVNWSYSGNTNWSLTNLSIGITGIDWNGSDFFVVDNTNDTVYILDANGQYYGNNISIGGGIWQDIALNSSHFFISEDGNNNVSIFNKDGIQEFSFAVSETAPRALASNETHYIITGTSVGVLEVRNKTGGSVHSIGSCNGIGCKGMKYNSTHFFIMDDNEQVFRIINDGGIEEEEIIVGVLRGITFTNNNNIYLLSDDDDYITNWLKGTIGANYELYIKMGDYDLLNISAISGNYDLNITKFNDILLNGCDCNDCKDNTTYCIIPFNISYNTVSASLSLELTNLSINFSYGIDSCNDSFGIPSNATALNITYYDNQSNYVAVEHSTYLNFTGGNFSQDSVTGGNFSYCVYPSWANLTIDQQIEYVSGGVTYTHLLNDIQYDNFTDYLSLFTQADTTQVLFTVLDRGEKLPNAFIHILKYNVGTGTYTTTEILRTDAQGQAIGNIVLGTTFYNFLIYYNGVLVYTENGVKLVSTTRTFNINLQGTEWLDNFDTSLDIYTNLYYNNDTNNFVFTWSDSTGQMHYGCLRVDKLNEQERTTLFDNCTETTSGTIVYNIAPLENGTEWIGTAYFKYDEEIIIDRVAFIVAKVRDFFTKMPDGALFIAFMITLTLFFIGIPNPAISSVLLALGAIASYMLGMLQVTILQIGAIAILVIIQLYLAGRQTQ